jgi:Fe-S cluster biogenesis protein NfuA
MRFHLNCLKPLIFHNYVQIRNPGTLPEARTGPICTRRGAVFIDFGSAYDYKVKNISRRKTIMRDKVEAALTKIRPMLQRDGGSVDLVDVEGTIVKVRLTGACKGCPMSQMTLKSGIERIIKQEVPEVTEVVSVN